MEPIFLNKKSQIFEFQRFHKEPWLMVCDLFIIYERITVVCTKAENLVSL